VLVEHTVLGGTRSIPTRCGSSSGRSAGPRGPTGRASRPASRGSPCRRSSSRPRWRPAGARGARRLDRGASWSGSSATATARSSATRRGATTAAFGLDRGCSAPSATTSRCRRSSASPRRCSLGVRARDELAVEAGRLMAVHPVGRLSWSEPTRELWLEHAILGDDLDARELEAAIDAVAALADAEDDRLQAPVRRAALRRPGLNRARQAGSRPRHHPRPGPSPVRHERRSRTLCNGERRRDNGPSTPPSPRSPMTLPLRTERLPRRGRRGRAAVAALLGVSLLGGLAAAGRRGTAQEAARGEDVQGPAPAINDFHGHLEPPTGQRRPDHDRVHDADPDEPDRLAVQVRGGRRRSTSRPTSGASRRRAGTTSSWRRAT
jgi:hypothetical protein